MSPMHEPDARSSGSDAVPPRPPPIGSPTGESGSSDTARTGKERHGPSARDSQESLALSIARAVQLGLPAPDSEEAIKESVEKALLAEAGKNEQLLAKLRAGLLGAMAVLATAVHLVPSLAGLRTFPYWPALAALLAAAGAGAFAIGLARGLYQRWLTRVVPAVDALGIVAAFYLLERSLDPLGVRAAPLGSFSAAAVACSMLAFSGSLRLSRPAAVFATACGLATWCAIWIFGELAWAAALVVGALILMMGALAGRVTRMIRGVIKDEILRIRLLQLYKDAEDAIDAREEVLKIVSHDLRNPLGTVAMAVDLLLDPRAPDANRTRHLQIIKRQGERMKHLVDDLLDAARLEAGRLSIDPAPTDLSALLESVLEMMRPLAEDRKLHLHTTVPPDLPRVMVDSERICQVFSNLIGNAIKFTPEGGHITLKGSRIGSKVRLSVADTGPGIPPDQLSQIFNNMWQARKDDARGIGLGLTIAKAIVEAHGERIGVDSRVGEGTEFWFTVPTVPEGAE